MSETHLSEIRVDPLINKEEGIHNNQPQELKMDETLGNYSLKKNERSSWFSFIMREVKDTKNNQPLGPKIPKVSDKLRIENEECYSPLMVSIGPYHSPGHHNNLREEEIPKVSMARQFILDSGKNIELVYREVEKGIQNAREFYNEIDMKGYDDEQFTRMMFLDGCFILQFIHCVTHNYENLEMTDRQVAGVKRDLLLLENQIPFPVLKSLTSLRYEKDGTNHGMKHVNDFLFFHILNPKDQPLRTRKLLWSTVSLLLMFLPIALPFVLSRTFSSYNHDLVFLSMVPAFAVMELCLLIPAWLLWLLLRKGRQASGYDSQWQPDEEPAHLLQLLYFLFVGPHNIKGKSSSRRCGHCLSYLATCLKKFIPTKCKPVARGRCGHYLYYTAKELKKVGGHCLSYLATCLKKFIPTKYKPVVARGRRGHYLYYSAKELKKVGIHFMSSQTSALTDVEFKSSSFHGTLKLPSITIDESTKSMLFNLVAYETSAALNPLRVTSYICFMDSLIDDSDDVKELRSKGIIINFHGPDQQVADLFNHMGSFLEPDTSVYNDVKREINEQCESIVKKWVAQWQQTYFHSPWAFIAFAAAAVGLALTATQTYYAMHPREPSKKN
ncbi:hypothetical protein H0E87_027588 [Populus deltoides]|uniref:Uncharacterized protein n=1 Tax=Populus deltoides TaxID=3696 RepID=A0A8T2X1A8_POPDE|nr:hypothetical protein H0E87_027588 [Populus deltoides]